MKVKPLHSGDCSMSTTSKRQKLDSSDPRYRTADIDDDMSEYEGLWGNLEKIKELGIEMSEQGLGYNYEMVIVWHPSSAFLNDEPNDFENQVIGRHDGKIFKGASSSGGDLPAAHNFFPLLKEVARRAPLVEKLQVSYTINDDEIWAYPTIPMILEAFSLGPRKKHAVIQSVERKELKFHVHLQEASDEQQCQHNQNFFASKIDLNEIKKHHGKSYGLVKASHAKQLLEPTMKLYMPEKINVTLDVSAQWAGIEATDCMYLHFAEYQENHFPYGIDIYWNIKGRFEAGVITQNSGPLTVVGHDRKGAHPSENFLYLLKEAASRAKAVKKLRIHYEYSDRMWPYPTVPMVLDAFHVNGRKATIEFVHPERLQFHVSFEEPTPATECIHYREDEDKYNGVGRKKYSRSRNLSYSNNVDIGEIAATHNNKMKFVFVMELLEKWRDC